MNNLSKREHYYSMIPTIITVVILIISTFIVFNAKHFLKDDSSNDSDVIESSVIKEDRELDSNNTN